MHTAVPLRIIPSINQDNTNCHTSIVETPLCYNLCVANNRGMHHETTERKAWLSSHLRVVQRTYSLSSDSSTSLLKICSRNALFSFRDELSSNLPCLTFALFSETTQTTVEGTRTEAIISFTFFVIHTRACSLP